MKIYVNPDNPHDIKSDSRVVAGYIICILGIIAVLSYVVYFFSEENRKVSIFIYSINIK